MATADPASAMAGRFLRVEGGGPSGRCPERAQDRLLEIAGAAGLELVHACSVELCQRGDDHYRRLVAAIDDARREICVEMYQVRPDVVGWEICTALGRAALRGVSVRLLLDSFGSARIGGWITALRRHGIDVRWYNPWRPWRNPWHRTHRKLIVVDGRTASIGGMNLADEFSERRSGGDAWRDMSVWLTGAAAWVLRRQFDAAWTAHGGGPAPPLSVPKGAGALCAVAGPRIGRATQASALGAMVDSACSELLLATPYFMPDRRFRSALADAARRDVRVVVTVPRRNDIWWFKHGGRRRYDELLGAGVTIVERCDRMVHAKVAVADRLVAAVGSTNLNRQSFYANSETLMLTTAPEVVAGVQAMICDEAAAAGDTLRRDDWARHPDRRPWAELVTLPMGLIF